MTKAHSQHPQTFTFAGVEDFEAMYKAEAFLSERGFSVGSNQRGDPRGILHGEYIIAKWRRSEHEGTGGAARPDDGTDAERAGHCDDIRWFATRSTKKDRIMTRDEVIKFGKRKYGEQWMARLAEDIGYSVSTVLRVATGEIPEVSRRMELEIEKLIRQHRFEALAKPDVRY